MDYATHTAYRNHYRKEIDDWDAKLHHPDIIIDDYALADAFVHHRVDVGCTILSFIDYRIVDRHLSLVACKNDPRSLLFAKPEFLDTEFFEEIFTPDHFPLIPFVAKEMWMCKEAVLRNPFYLDNVPLSMRTFQICDLAYHLNKDVIEFVPIGFREQLKKQEIRPVQEADELSIRTEEIFFVF